MQKDMHPTNSQLREKNINDNLEPALPNLTDNVSIHYVSN